MAECPARTLAYSLHGNRYLNVTSRCTLRCAFCPKFSRQWTVQGYPLRLREEAGCDELIEAAGDPAAFSAIVFCGLGEPLLYPETVLETARRLRELGATRLRVNTDGLANRIHGGDLTPRLGERIDALSISLNGHDAATYAHHCRPPFEGAFEAVLDFAARAREHVAEVTLTAIDGLDGLDIGACEQLAQRLGTGFRARTLGQVG